MRLTDEQVMQDNKRFANCNALAELKYCGWDIPHRKSITNDEIHFYAWLCRSAVALLKEQEKQVKQWTKEIADNQLAHAPDERNPEEWDYRKGIWDGLQIAWNIISEGR